MDVNWLGNALLGKDSNLPGDAASDVLSLSSSRNYVAVGCQNLSILDVRSQTSQTLDLPQSTKPNAVNESITALSWVMISPQETWRIYKDVELILLGTSTGHLGLYEHTGRQIVRQRVHDTACTNITVKAAHQGLDPDDPSDEIVLGFKDAAARIHNLEIMSAFMHAKSSGWGSQGIATALHFTKWTFPKSIGERQMSILIGSSPASLFQRMADRSHSPKVSILTIGRKPSVALLEGPEFGGEGLLAAVSDLASGLGGLAKSLAYGRPNGYRAGLSGWMGRSKAPPLNTEKEEPTPKGHSSSLMSSFDDEPRIATSIAMCPRGPLTVVADNLGRVMLIDSVTCLVLYMWKAYRRAQLAWLPVQDVNSEERNYLLVIFAPNRLAMEVWDTKTCSRQCSWPCSKLGLLTTPQAAFGSNESSEPYFIDFEQGRIENLAQKFSNLNPR